MHTSACCLFASSSRFLASSSRFLASSRALTCAASCIDAIYSARPHSRANTNNSVGTHLAFFLLSQLSVFRLDLQTCPTSGQTSKECHYGFIECDCMLTTMTSISFFRSLISRFSFRISSLCSRSLLRYQRAVGDESTDTGRKYFARAPPLTALQGTPLPVGSCYFFLVLHQ